MVELQQKLLHPEQFEFTEKQLKKRKKKRVSWPLLSIKTFPSLVYHDLLDFHLYVVVFIRVWGLSSLGDPSLTLTPLSSSALSIE